MSFSLDTLRIGVIGLGYVGLPLAVEFGRKYPTVGFDVKAGRIAELKAGEDSTLEVDADELATATKLRYTDDVEQLESCNFYIVTVPTPVSRDNRPLLRPLKLARNSAASAVEPDVTFRIDGRRCSLSPGLIRSGLYPAKKSVLSVSPEFSSMIGIQNSSVAPGKTVDS